MQAAASRNEDRLTVGADELRFRGTSADSDGALLAFEIRMPPGGREHTVRNESAAEAAAHGVEITRPLEAIR